MEQKLRDMLVCPMCKGTLEEVNLEFICSICKLAYPIVDDIPVMLATDARKIGE